ncbi:DUF4153 domain-containing protein [Psychrosphaera sp. B3R10]|uniref:DUF4153 domain-containing protein n=1 Tax=unclassified Psychrosphaera TaxID=2641570 RepID=UPI001C09F80C|nr:MULTISPECIES: DUF4153 domain-containing protein [unclassified Psychrosphaera]MBU2882777.1 DUF4153 domain-containing protein [Psychrosphaera sp. I2R16]MBU2988777.1 DUF4153 domain-containing protein [Psychrosphaera sp. B3R10]
MTKEHSSFSGHDIAGNSHLKQEETAYYGAQLSRISIAIIALLQGLTLAYLYKSVDLGFWPGSDLIWLVALVTFFISFPSLFLLTASKHDYKAIIKYLLPFTLFISALGAYTSHQYSAFPSLGSSLFVFTFAILIACFKAIMYMKLLVNNQRVNYESLFSASWRNAIIFVLTLIFMAIFFGILHLGAALFDLLGIKLFSELLMEEWFWLPVLTLASAFAIYIFRKIGYLTDNISTILQTLMTFLLPVLIFVSLGFLITLPFTGLDNLWQTKSGSFLLLWLIALSLFFVNAIYHKGNDNKPYHFIVHRFILIGVAILPVYSVISVYGIIVRIDQYGLTPDRLWALSVWFILSCFVAGYFIGIVRLRDNWLVIQSKVNVVMGLVVLAFVLLVNSPLLNFKAISSDSQMARYYSGEVLLKDLDIRYFSRSLGRPGYLAMQQLKTEITQSDPEIAVVIDKQYRYIKKRVSKDNRNKVGEAEPEVEIVYWPNKDAFNPDLLAYINNKDNYFNGWTNVEYRISIDLDQDGTPEMLTIGDQNGYYRGKIWTNTEKGWENRIIRIDVPDNKDLAYSLQNLEIQLSESKYKVIKLDGIHIDAN